MDSRVKKHKRRVRQRRLLVPIGVSGSGKSTSIKEFEKQGFSIVSPDMIRKELTGNIVDQSRNKEVFEIAHNRVDELLGQGKDVVFDATNVNPISRRQLMGLANKNQGTVEAILFKVPLGLAAARIRRRVSEGGHDVPRRVLKNQRRQLGRENVLIEPYKKLQVIRLADQI